MTATVDVNVVLQALTNQRNAALDECVMLAARIAELEQLNKELMAKNAKPAELRSVP